MAENSRRRWRRRAIIAGAIAAGAALVLLGAVVLLLAADRLPPRKAPWYDYSALLQVLSDPAVRYPTAKELKAFPVLWPTVPVDENAALCYAKAVRLLKETGNPTGSPGSGEPYAGDMAALEAWVTANKPARDMAVEAHSHPVFRMPIFISTVSNMWIAKGYPNPFPLNWLGKLRYIRWSFGDAGLVEELNGNPHAAVEQYLACLRMGAQVRNGVRTQSLVACGILSMGTAGLEQLVANAVLPDEDLRKIIQVCSEVETRPGEIADTVECEAEWEAADLQIGTLRAKMVVRIADIIHGGGRGLAVARKDANIPIYKVINNPAAQLALENTPAGVGEEALAEFWKWRASLARMDTELRVLQIRAAIALYQRQHANLPETLDALCPQFLPKVPLDPFSDKPLRYRITEKGWVVWSVGRDLTDTGGEIFVGKPPNMHLKDGIYMSAVRSRIEQLQSRTVNTLNSNTEDREMAALAAERAAHPEVDFLGLTPLHRAANSGDLAAVEALLAKGADVNARGLAKQTPLHLAVTKEIAQLLISKGAQIEARDRHGRTPLFWAAGAGRKDVVEALLAGGAQADAPEATDTEMNNLMAGLRSQLPAQMKAIAAPQSARTPITYAAEQGHDDIADLLRKYLAEHPAKQQSLPAR